MKRLSLLLCLLLCSDAFAQEIRYIRDQLFVPLRSGQSIQHRIVHKGLVSGTALTLLEEEGEYSKVVTENGIEGWIQSQYLVDQPVAKDLLKKAQATISQLNQRNKSLQQQLNEATGARNTTSKELAQISSHNSKISKELERIKSVSAKALQLDSDNKKLLLENVDLKNQVDLLSADNQRLIDTNENEAFLNGAFAVLIGVMITLLVPRLWPKKKNDWN